MGKAKWWVCDSCVSLNDLPANKCYKCAQPRPGNPKLIDDQYSEVRDDSKRVGITVDLSQVGELTRPDPKETAEGGALMEAFEKVDDPYADLDGPRTPDAQGSSTPRYDPYIGGFESTLDKPPPKPLREPAPRGIEALGGRPWRDEPDPGRETAEPASAEPASTEPAAAEPASTQPEIAAAEQDDWHVAPPPPAGLPPMPPAPATSDVGPGPVPPPPPGGPPSRGPLPPPGPVPPLGPVPPAPGAPPPPPGPPPPPAGAPRPPDPRSAPPGVPHPPGAMPVPPPPPGVQGRPPGPPPPPAGPPRPPGGPPERPRDT